MPYTKEQMVALLRECKKDPLMCFNVDYWDKKKKDPYEWKVVYVGPKKTPYEGGIFTVKVVIPQNYPEERPKFYFITRIFHLNIYWLESNSDGHVCFGSTVTKDVKELLKLVETYFSFQYPDSTWYDSKVQQEYKDYRDGKSKIFYEKAQNWVYLYAGLNQLKK
jgi:ubiquitin-protein ligase